MAFIAQFYLIVAAVGLVGITVMVIRWVLRDEVSSETARRAGSASRVRLGRAPAKTSRSDTTR